MCHSILYYATLSYINEFKLQTLNLVTTYVGFGWDPLLERLTAPDSIWNIYANDPKYAKDVKEFRIHGFDLYRLFFQLYGDRVITLCVHRLLVPHLLDWG